MERMHKELKLISSLHVYKFKTFMKEKDDAHKDEVQREKRISDRHIKRVTTENLNLNKRIL